MRVRVLCEDVLGLVVCRLMQGDVDIRHISSSLVADVTSKQRNDSADICSNEMQEPRQGTLLGSVLKNGKSAKAISVSTFVDRVVSH